ncbi:MAG: hypothetical protein U0Y68_00245 [Blastocatellia bacterium]
MLPGHSKTLSLFGTGFALFPLPTSESREILAIFWSETGIYVNIPFSFTEWGKDMRRKPTNFLLTLLISSALGLSGVAQGRDKKDEKKPEKPQERVVEKDKDKRPTPTPPPKRKPGE